MKIFMMDDGKNGAIIIIKRSKLCKDCLIMTKVKGDYWDCVEVNDHIYRIFTSFENSEKYRDDQFTLCGKIKFILDKFHNVNLPYINIEFIVEAKLSIYVSRYIVKNYEDIHDR